MSTPDKDSPPATDPQPGHNPGYAETEPRDKEDAQDPRPRRPPNPDVGGLDREPEEKPGAADD